MSFFTLLVEQSPATFVSEEALQQAIVFKARELGFRVFFLPDDLQKSAVAEGRFDLLPFPGWPDLVLGGFGRLLYVEVKSERGRLRRPQMAWRDLIRASGGEWHCWRPSDFGWIVEFLGGIADGRADRDCGEPAAEVNPADRSEALA